MRTSRRNLISRFGMTGVLVVLTLIVALSQVAPTAQAPTGVVVVAVPWSGKESKAHVVYSGGYLMLQASASVAGDGNPVTLLSASWDPGDGTGPVAISTSNSRNLELRHQYSGADYTPYTATISVTDSGGNILTDTFKVQIVPRTLEAEVNMAIDHGLWNLHKAMTRTVSGGQRIGNWNDAYGYPMAATGATVQAFQVNGHRETGDRLKDPYVDNSARGLRYLQLNVRRRAIGMQVGGDPDTNGNGYGLEDPSHEPVYVGGTVIDGFVASGTPNAVVTLGTEVGRTYRDIVQDMLETYAWGADDAGADRGAWVYQWNDQGGVDSSSSGWWGVGQLAGEVWGASSPEWAKILNRDVSVPALQNSGLASAPGTGRHGACSYRANGGDATITRTTACMILMSADGMPRSSDRFRWAEGWVARNWVAGEAHGSLYGMYNLAKAMRTAKADDGSPAPITLLGGTIDWYGADPYPNSPTHAQNGMARYLVGRQQINGAFFDYNLTRDLSTAASVLILSPALFEQAPDAVCRVDGGTSSTVCSASTPAGTGCNALPGNPFSTVSFDANLSTPGDNAIATYSWDFDDGSALDPLIATTHAFNTLGTFAVKLTVADAKGNSTTAVCPVEVTSDALPPVARPGPADGGDYNVCLSRNQSVVLDGSNSVERGSEIVSYEWDFTNPTTFVPAADATGAITDQTAYFTGLGPGSYGVALRVTDDLSRSVVAYTSVNMLTADDPLCNKAPVATNNSYTTSKNNAVSGNVATDGTADSDGDGDTFTASVVAGPASGTLAFNATGAFTFTPATGFDGTVTFTYKQTDQFGGVSNTATVTIVVLPNVDPAAANDGASTFSGTPVTVTVLANDTDADAGQTLSVTGTSGGPANGSAVVNGDGTITYTPNLGFAGTDTFTYSISDGNGGTASATVTITVSKRAATVTAGGGTKVYGTADPALGTTQTGFLVADAAAIALNTTRESGESVGGYATTATATGGNVSNYDVTYVAGSMSITPATLTVTTNSYTRSYLALDPVFGGTLTGVVAGDGITVVYSSTGAGSQVPGTYPIVPTLVDPGGKLGNYAVASTGGTLTITNTAPVCTIAPSVTSIWPPNHKWVPVTASGATDVDGGPLTYTVVSIFQDEPTNTEGDGHTAIDGKGVGTNTAWVTAERMGKSWKDAKSGKGSAKSTSSGKSGKSSSSSKSDKGGGNGRVYHITFTVTDSLGLSCTATVLVGVPHDQSGPAPVDDGALYDSTVATPKVKSAKSEKSAKSAKAAAKASSKAGAKAPKGKK